MPGVVKWWPLVVVSGLLAAQAWVGWPLGLRGALVLCLLAAVCAAALLASRWPAPATAVALGASFAVTGIFAGFTRALLLPGAGVAGVDGFEWPLGPLTFPETVAFAVLLASVVRVARPRVAAGCVAALALLLAHALRVRGVEGVFERLPDGSVRPFAGGWAVIGLLLALAVLVGLLLRSHDRERAVALERVRVEERLDIARELHDVVAHHVTGMLVQAQAALVVGERDPDAARRALPAIVDGGTDAVGAMRRLVGALRGKEDAATADLEADLRALVGRARESGLPVRVAVELPAPVPPELGRSVLRLVQEGLTNVRKHARDPGEVVVEVVREPTVVTVSVVDCGEPASFGRGGFGIVGMRERVELLGGRFHAGPTPGGWVVSAELPLVVRA
ncbi:sensor histidine kinase [Actinosynnema mirum]|uniref:histidine kinase n=1 Tax=Actinosynnema mirum (strain ATCC 29888 / DSM 43827 / JCM 3225 / NBRC 14064 / NCIMB 13271 / NRRL B-12336 / IMRU 3971 / 101) TaxID=446462 RepID=C6W8M7_ACTMD|nr:histidine kinase [Actinosynnema mirum]ACU37126.1 histidine kinase [Actinosynnema mirum DSM 43827]